MVLVSLSELGMPGVVCIRRLSCVEAASEGPKSAHSLWLSCASSLFCCYRIRQLPACGNPTGCIAATAAALALLASIAARRLLGAHTVSVAAVCGFMLAACQPGQCSACEEDAAKSEVAWASECRQAGRLSLDTSARPGRRCAVRLSCRAASHCLVHPSRARRAW